MPIKFLSDPISLFRRCNKSFVINDFPAYHGAERHSAHVPAMKIAESLASAWSAPRLLNEACMHAVDRPYFMDLKLDALH